MKIAIDGPAGAGKSTIAKLAAKRMGFVYIDTGAMFRAIALYFLNNNIDVDNEEVVASACDKISIKIEYLDGVQQIYLNSENVSNLIRTEEVGNAASKVATNANVRSMLLRLQRQLAEDTDVIMDGRDIGTAVLKDAELKIYLTASVEVRAKRRFDELVEKGLNADIEVIMDDIEKRDYQDMNRSIAPLKKAYDAVLIDSSNMTIDDVVDYICSEAKR